MFQEYVWQKYYYDAVLECDPRKLSHLISQAEKQIEERLENYAVEIDPSEGKAIEETLLGLSVLKSERLA